MDIFNHIFGLQMPTWDIVLRLALASGAGALLGWDRETSNKPAGIRTFTLVSLGAAGFMIFSTEMTLVMSSSNIQIDPTRTMQGIIGGIGFLGAGSIIRSGGEVRGITTAATTWVAGSVGAICGAGLYGLGIMITLFGFITLAGVGRLKYRTRLEGENGDDLPTLSN